ncbi:hypothetical protein F5051DRAFT_382491 [Lentinula edodes]|nr:hypothetical protein F5051DRAFT_382491 [Lentinula edodes]
MKYMGIWHQTAGVDMYQQQYKESAKKAKKTAGAVLHAKVFVGENIPIWDLWLLYMGRVDPYLKNGAEVIVDIYNVRRKQLESVQHYFIRRMLGLNDKSMVALLFSETGLWPIRYRRTILFLKNLKYLVQLKRDHLAWKACRQVYELAEQGKNSVFMEMPCSGPQLHVPKFKDLTMQHIDGVMERVKKSMEKDIQEKVDTSNKTRDGLKDRREHYLRIPIGEHRRSLIDMVTSNHKLAVERLRWAERNKPMVQHDKRLCRMCREKVEDGAHVLFECSNSCKVIQLRKAFMQRVMQEIPHFARHYGDGWELFGELLADKRVVGLLAKYVHEVLEVFYAVEIYWLE